MAHPQASSAWPLWVKCRDPYTPTRKSPGSLVGHMGPPCTHPPRLPVVVQSTLLHLT